MKYLIFLSALFFSTASVASEHSDSETQNNSKKRALPSQNHLEEAEAHAAMILQRLQGTQAATILQAIGQIPSAKKRLTFDRLPKHVLLLRKN